MGKHKVLNQRLIVMNAVGEWRLAFFVQRNRKGTVAEKAEEVNTGSDGKVSQCITGKSGHLNHQVFVGH